MKLRRNEALEVAAILFLVLIITLCFLAKLLMTQSGLAYEFLPHALMVTLGGFYGLL